MKIGKQAVKVFKMKNRRGYAAIANDCLTEGSTQAQAVARMAKALKRVEKRNKK